MNRPENPILPGFHPDPSLCRVGEDFYLACSSFHWFPGIPLFHSRDLRHWRLLGYALERPSQLPLSRVKSSEGIYAPTLRHHDGRFYLIAANISRGGNFLVVADNPAGPWSEPRWLELPGADPSVFFDSDGRAYLQTQGSFSGILQAEWNPRTHALSSWQCIWPGTGGRFPEGPHLYKIHGCYYLLIAEGGTEYGHMVTIARAKTPWGPFLPCPGNPILSHRDRAGSPIQGVGHADMVQDSSGQWWLVCLGFRPQGGHYHHLGRETFLAPVSWDQDGWPVVNQGRPLGSEISGPRLAPFPWPEPSAQDDFDAVAFRPEWNFLRNPDMTRYSLSQRPGWLRLQGTAPCLDDPVSPTFLARRQQHFHADIQTLVDFSPSTDGEEAGLTCFMDEQHHLDCYLTRMGQKRVLRLRQRVGWLQTVLGEQTPPEGPVELMVKAEPLAYQVGWKTREGKFCCLGKAETRLLSTEVAGGFTGVFIGLYATGSGQTARNPADFDWFSYSPTPDPPGSGQAL